MKKYFFLVIVAIFIGLNETKAQSSYVTALGLGIDFGEGQTLVGPSVKHFFSDEHAGMGEVGFGDGVTF